MGETLFHRLAVAVDGSAYADRALTIAIDLARRYDAEITVLSVAPLTAYVATTEPFIPVEVLQGEVSHYRGIVDQAVAKVRAAGWTKVTGVCLEGHITEELVAYLDAHPVDLLLLGSRGLSGSRRLLLGSTSDEVLHHVSCPVLVVRPPKSPAAA